MDCSTDSSDTIILVSDNDMNEPSDSEIENILKKYSSTSSSVDFKESISLQNDVGEFSKELNKFLPHTKIGNSDKNCITLFKEQRKNYSHDKHKYNLEDNFDDNANNGTFSDEDLIDFHVTKRLKKGEGETCKNESMSQKKNCRYQNKYCLEHSSNDSNIKITENNFVDAEQLDMESDDIFRELYNKYSPSVSKSDVQETNHVVLSDDSGADEPNHGDFSQYVKKLSHSVTSELEQGRKPDTNNYDINKSSEEEPSQEFDELSPKSAAKLRKQRELDKKKKHRAREKERKQEEVERKKAMRNEEREKKKEAMEKQKVMKDALKTVEKSIKPDECIKHMVVVVPPEIFQKDYGDVLKQTLSNNGTSFKSTYQVLPNLVTWCRKIQTIENMLLKNTEVNENYFLLIMDKSEFFGAYSLKKEEKYKLQSEFFNDSNKDTIRVDKNGNGLGRLWHQMLTMFPLARLETAEAITAAYPTPISLFNAYDSCETKKEELLQDLPIRRALGPCISVRRIGPELSKKCYNFFCSTDNVFI
ncbi:hypothetical protein NQ314_015665 [Rhamnusium bicolor]|uniref:Crossover junction endonuclease EME1 n=1 Tax=Rhamnusium bicolor TaxID=1586634 RepID=A0AAV8WYA8_9CUCU|nr:hypothetical protein NQ314_015665 [Rhamnusium bicolor]